MKLKVGILTFHDGVNYGAFMQVYSLQRVLESLGYDVEVINYKKFSFWVKEYVHFIKMDGRFFKNFKKIRKFQEFHKKYLNLTPLSFSVNGKFDRYDAVFLGSDEIWNVNNPGFSFDASFFGRGLNTRLISYAPSFGSTDESDVKLSKIINDLNRFDRISVRDYNSFHIVEKITGKKARIVLDPTLLIEQDSLAINPVKDHPYLLVYASFCLSDFQASEIKKYAKTNNLKVISIGFYQSFADENYIDLNPFEWLGFIKYANVVVTSMFHGTLFSVIYGRRLSILMTEYRKQKFSYVIDKLDLENNIWEKNNDLKFPETNMVSSELIEDSLGFLKI